MRPRRARPHEPRPRCAPCPSADGRRGARAIVEPPHLVSSGPTPSNRPGTRPLPAPRSTARKAVTRSRRPARRPRPDAPAPCVGDSRSPGRPRGGRWRRPTGGAPWPGWGDVGGEGVLQRLQRHQRVAAVLAAPERVPVHEVRLHVCTRDLDRARHQRLQGVGHVVRLVEHVGGRETGHARSSASTSSLKIRKSWKGLIEPESRSSSPYLLSLK